MTVFIYRCFETLKEKVLQQANISMLNTADCSYLSSAILAKTKKSISETTIKRVYGFANSRFKPSAFTLNTLAQYCNYKSWDEFCAQEKLPVKTTTIYENSASARAEVITRNTLQALKSRCSIPYYHTIDRKIIHDHLSAFNEEDYSATIITGPAGAGKTIGLCHWVDGQIALNAIKQTGDIYLFFSSHLLNNSIQNENHLEKWLLSLLGIETGDIPAIFSGTNRKLYFIIDGFDEHLFKTEQFDHLFDQIIDVVSCHKDDNWFKLILTMSSVTWSLYKSRISQFHILRDKWHLGYMQDDHSASSNIKPFTLDELLLLAEKINPNEFLPQKIEDDVLEVLSYPEYFAYFYHIHANNFSLRYAKPAFIYNLLSNYILDKIYTGRNSAEKVLLINNLANEMNWQKHEASVNKLSVQNSTKTYNKAYRELIYQAILRESNKSNPLKHTETIQFGNNHLTRYFLTKKILKDNEEKISQNLVSEAQLVTVGEDDYLGVLKWVILYAISIKDYSIFEYLTHIKLYSTEKTDLMIFICDHLNEKHAELYEQKEFNQFIKNDFNFFNTFLKVPFLSLQYTDSISHLLRFNLPVDKIFIIKSLMVISDILSGNIENAKKIIAELLIRSEDIVSIWPFNPALGLHTILQYFVYEKVEKAAYKEITHYIFNENDIYKYTSVYDVVFFVSVYTSILFKNYKKSARFVQLIRNAVPKINGVLSPELNLCTSMVECRLAMFTGDVSRASALYDFLANRYKHQQNNFTLTIRLFFLALKTQAVILLEKKEDLMNLNKQIANLSGTTNYMFFDILNKSFLINTKNINHLSAEDIQAAHLSMIKTARVRGLKLESLIRPYNYDADEHKMKSQA